MSTFFLCVLTLFLISPVFSKKQGKCAKEGLDQDVSSMQKLTLQEFFGQMDMGRGSPPPALNPQEAIRALGRLESQRGRV